MHKPVFFLIRARNAFTHFDRCITSVFSQRNTNYTIIYIDDASALSTQQKKYIKQKLHHHITQFNSERKYSIRNAYEAIHRYVPDNGMVVSLDGDDWLVGDDVIDRILYVYDKTHCSLTYGNCFYYQPGSKHNGKAITSFHPFANTRYPPHVERDNLYRLTPFRAFHLRTWRAYNFKNLDKSNFLFPDGSWLRFCEDQAIMYALLETKGISYSVIDAPLSVYNTSHPYQDELLYRHDKLIDEVAIRRMCREGLRISDTDNRRVTGSTVTLVRKRLFKNRWEDRLSYLKDIVALIFQRPAHEAFRGEDRLLEKILAWFVTLIYDNCSCSTTSIGYSLSFILIPITLSLQSNKEIPIKTLADYEQVMWTLTNTSIIDGKTYNLFAKKGIQLSRLIKRKDFNSAM
jgi:glycosyltransferase involved in cell wall biosynthesis